MSERRNALKIIGTIGATCAFPFGADELYAQQEHSHGSATGQAKLPEPSYFTKEQLADVAAVAERIIPATDTPGAIAAGVPAYIDFVVGRNKALQPVFTAGFTWLTAQAKGKAFAGLSEAEQLAILEPVCARTDGKSELTDPGDRFFKAVKQLASDGYWTSQIGMGQTLGFKGNSILGAYPECIHEH